MLSGDCAIFGANSGIPRGPSMKLTVVKSPTGRHRGEPLTPTTKLQARIEYAELEEMVLKMWERFPHLHLPHKYGQDLIEMGNGELVLPEHPEAVYEWPWRKVQQYFVRLTLKDPGEIDNTGTRANLVGAIRGRLADRALLDRFIQTGHAGTPAVSTPRPLKVKPRRKS